MPTVASEMMGSAFEKPANLNILSHEDLTNPTLQMVAQQEKSRPMTTKFASRRFTQ